jgi:hypothetical protein
VPATLRFGSTRARPQGVSKQAPQVSHRSLIPNAGPARIVSARPGFALRWLQSQEPSAVERLAIGRVGLLESHLARPKSALAENENRTARA